MGFLFQIDQPDYFVFIQSQGDDIIVLSVFRAERNILRRETDPPAFWGVLACEILLVFDICRL